MLAPQPTCIEPVHGAVLTPEENYRDEAWSGAENARVRALHGERRARQFAWSGFTHLE